MPQGSNGGSLERHQCQGVDPGEGVRSRVCSADVKLAGKGGRAQNGTRLAGNHRAWGWQNHERHCVKIAETKNGNCVTNAKGGIYCRCRGPPSCAPHRMKPCLSTRADNGFSGRRGDGPHPLDGAAKKGGSLRGANRLVSPAAFEPGRRDACVSRAGLYAWRAWACAGR